MDSLDKGEPQILNQLEWFGIRMVQVAHSQMHMPPLWNCCCAWGQYGRDMKQSWKTHTLFVRWSLSYCFKLSYNDTKICIICIFLDNNFVPRENHLDRKLKLPFGTSQGHADAIALFAELSVDGVPYLGWKKTKRDPRDSWNGKKKSAT